MSLETYPREGDLVRFEPPELAYSADCAQTQVVGQTGTVYRVDNDSYTMVFFGKDLVLVNTAYLTLISHAYRQRIIENCPWSPAIGEDETGRAKVKRGRPRSAVSR